MDRHIVPVTAARDGGPAVVLEVKQTGSHPLDVQLVGCEGENVYVTTLKHRDIASFKKKASKEEWEAILSHFLLQKQPEGKDAAFLENLRMEYSTLDDESIQVAIRRDVQGIKMTLGQFELKQSDQEIDPIDWAYTSAQGHNAALKEIAQLKARIDGEQGTLDKLNAQFEAFLKAKDETETAMLQQFMGLLNEKKRKIRDQNRLLAGSPVDSKAAVAVQSAREETKPRKAGPSRVSKRKAPAKAAPVEEESGEEQMEINETKAEEQDDESGLEAATPDRSTDEETEDEDDLAPPAQSQEPSAALSNNHATRSQTLVTEPPPKRELPFSRSRAAKKKPSPPAVEEDDGETEDEL